MSYRFFWRASTLWVRPRPTMLVAGCQPAIRPRVTPLMAIPRTVHRWPRHDFARLVVVSGNGGGCFVGPCSCVVANTAGTDKAGILTAPTSITVAHKILCQLCKHDGTPTSSTSEFDFTCQGS